MYPPKVLQENYIKDLNRGPPHRNLSRPLVAFFAVCQFLFGFNFGFMESCGISKTASRLTTAVSGCIVTIILFLAVILNGVGSYTYLVYLLQYIPIFIILWTARYTLRDFLADLLAKNEKTSPEDDDKLGIFLWLYTSIMFTAKISSGIAYSYYYDSRLVMMHFVIHIPMMALNIISIANFVIFYYVYARLKDLRHKYGQREISLELLRISFKEVADEFEKFRSNYDGIFVVGFVTESSKWMFIIWNYVKLLRYSSSWLLYWCSCTWALFITIHICVPAVFAEMISVETDAMKMILRENILVETDEKKSFEMSRLLRYVAARPLLRKAWRLVPVDLRLPVTMLSMCATYLIVIIQFSHIYD